MNLSCGHYTIYFDPTIYDAQAVRDKGAERFADEVADHWCRCILASRGGMTADEYCEALTVAKFFYTPLFKRYFPPIRIYHHKVEMVVVDHLKVGKIAWDKGLTNVEISRRSGIADSDISQFRRTDKRCKRSTAERLAKALGVDVEEILDRSDPCG